MFLLVPVAGSRIYIFKDWLELMETSNTYTHQEVLVFNVFTFNILIT